MNGNFQRNFILVLLVSVLVISLLTVLAAAESKDTAPRGISARSAALYSPDTDSFLYEKEANTRLPMASTTKIMTALLALEDKNGDRVVKIPKEATGIEGSSVYLEEGEEILLIDLCYALLLQSANDAATAIATEISGSAESFASLMNEKALELGLTDTHFDNPHGLDSAEHYTTAKDLAILAARAMENEKFMEITSTYKYSFTSLSGKERTVVNHNKLLKTYSGTLGVKTGFTKKSGRCLVGAAERNGIRLISVTLDAPDDWSDHKKLFDYGFERMTRIDSDTLTESEFTIPVMSGEKDLLKCEKKPTGPITLQKGEEIRAITYLPRYTVAPVNKGDIVGKIVYKNGEKELFTADIYATEDVNKAKFGIFDIFS